MLIPYIVTDDFSGQKKLAVGNLSDCRSRGHEFDPARSHTKVEIDHQIISTAILLLSADSTVE